MNHYGEMLFAFKKGKNMILYGIKEPDDERALTEFKHNNKKK